jgi:hypothetical protein
MSIEFSPFPKIARYSRTVVVTEKIDGTNAQVHITDDGQFLTGSRTRWITPADDNAGFSRWAHENKEELMKLGPGSHFGEWWGQGIQRRYDLTEKRFSLFNTHRWSDEAGARPSCCHVVPILWTGILDDLDSKAILNGLALNGSVAAPGFKKPEGIVIYHVAAGQLFKKTLDKDDEPKSKQNA